MSIKKVIKDSLTENDDQTYSWVPVLTFLAFALVAFVAIYELIVNKRVVDRLGEWLSYILGGGGVGRALSGFVEGQRNGGSFISNPFNRPSQLPTQVISKPPQSQPTAPQGKVNIDDIINQDGAP